MEGLTPMKIWAWNVGLGRSLKNRHHQVGVLEFKIGEDLGEMEGNFIKIQCIHVWKFSKNELKCVIYMFISLFCCSNSQESFYLVRYEKVTVTEFCSLFIGSSSHCMDWTRWFWLQSQVLGGTQFIHLVSSIIFPIGNVNYCLVALKEAFDKCFIIAGER